MRRKVMVMILVACMGIGLCACSKEPQKQSETKEETEAIEKNDDEIEDSKEESTAEDEANSDPGFTLQTSVRPAGTKGKNWTDNLDVNIGDEIEYQILYKNTSDEDQYDVMLRDVLPEGVEYIPGTTRLWNEHATEATIDQDDLVTDGINIGAYGPGANGYVRFNAKIVDKGLECGSNMLVNWGQGTVNDELIQDYANVHLDKE